MLKAEHIVYIKKYSVLNKMNNMQSFAIICNHIPYSQSIFNHIEYLRISVLSDRTFW